MQHRCITSAAYQNYIYFCREIFVAYCLLKSLAIVYTQLSIMFSNL